MNVTLAKGLSLPAAELATEVVASLGMRGSGKSNGAAVIAEGLLAAKIQIIVLDYVGTWFSLRLGGNGSTAAFDIPVLGGKHGDITLVPSTGAVIAEALARTHSSAVLDISMFSKGDRARFATDFAEMFFRAKKDHPGPVQLLLEEAQRFVPQKLFAGSGMERMLGAFEEIAEVGRNFGIGLHLISQRPQKINKDVLNLADTVFAYRTNGVLERKAVSEWVQEKGAEGRKELHDELPGLPRGTAVVWSPVREIYGRYAVRKRETYDAAATPIHARAAVKTKPLDLGQLETAMGAAVEEAKANDPKTLRARIAELERQLKTTAPAAASKPAISDGQIKRVEMVAESLAKAEGAFSAEIARLIERLAQNQQKATIELGSLRSALQEHTVVVKRGRDIQNGVNRDYGTHITVRPDPRPPVRVRNADEPGLSRAARAILRALAQLGHGTDARVSIVSGYRVTSSSFANALSELRTAGLIAGSRDRLEITQAGREEIGPVDPLPTGKALLEYWRSQLGRCEATLLSMVYSAGTVRRDVLSEMSGYSVMSSSFANGLSKLRTLELIHGPPGGDLTISEAFG